MNASATFTHDIPAQFHWLNPPQEFTINQGLNIITDPETDFWQRTHYGFRRDNGHCLLTELNDDFQITTSVRFHPQNRYDQCGLIIRLDENNWIKVSVEFIDPQLSELGSVVTSLGYSDWATTEISSEIQQMWYRASRCGNDFLLQNSSDGRIWKQLRVTHLHAAAESLQVGIYACSPSKGRFQCTFARIIIEENQWQKP